MEMAAISECWFKGLVTLVTLALCANVLVGPSLRWRPVFISGLLGSIVACEYYYLFFAVMKVPKDWATNRGVSMQRWDCLQSTKGGKSGEGSTSSFDINPCFCLSDGYCKNDVTGLWMDPLFCPRDGSGSCWGADRVEIPLYIESGRDCAAGQGTSCTLKEPCTPCDAAAVEAYITAGVSGASRCRRCGVGNRGDCNFVIDEGPYCWKELGSTEIEPCSVCCTEPQVMDIHGTCY